MLHRDSTAFVGNLCLVVGGLLLFLVTTRAAVAQNPVPLINQPLVPDAVEPGKAGFILTVNGSGFVSRSVAHWNGSALPTTFVSDSQLKASVPASDVAQPGTASVTVVNPSPGGGTSNVVFFAVTPPTTAIALAATVGSGTYPGIYPSPVAVGDFNRDGNLDLAVGNKSSNNVTVLLGNGDGTFEAAVNYATGSEPWSVAVGDFNGNGKLDLIVANTGSNNVSVLLGNGDGTFQAAVNYGTGSGPWSVAVGDFNADGKLDLIVANTGSNNVSVLLGNGDGTFQPAVNYGAVAQPVAIATGDFDRDGKLDLAVTSDTGANVSVLLGNGDGTFQSAVNYNTGGSPRSVALGDFNNDGKLDLAVANLASNNVTVLLGNGDGTFQAAVNYDVGVWPMAVALGDFNGDGKLDLVTANNNGNNVSVLFGNGDGTFQEHQDFSGILHPESLAIGDFNGDGRLDIAVPFTVGMDQVAILLQAPTVALSSTSLSFGDQVVGTSSAPHTVTLSNGSSVLASNLTNIAITGTNAADFSQANTCGSGLPPGGECTITATFAPSRIGPRSASVTITDNAAGSPEVVALSGTGVVSGPNVTVSATSLMFATQLVGTSSLAQSVTLSNYGTATLNITSIGFAGADPGDFHETNTCGSSVVPGASCTINVTFSPTQRGSRTAALSVPDNAPGSPQTVSLGGTGTVVQLNPTSWNFGQTGLGQSKSLQTTLTNVGSTTLNISSIKITGADTDEFHQTNNCGSSLGPGKSCSIAVIYRPTEQGLDEAQISISHDGGGSPQQVSLLGLGCMYVGRCFL
jgi:hypothetical protein